MAQFVVALEYGGDSHYAEQWIGDAEDADDAKLRAERDVPGYVAYSAEPVPVESEPDPEPPPEE